MSLKVGTSLPRILCVVAAVLAVTGSAAADDAATAEALFNKGFADMQAGRHAKGCPAIAESQRLDPRPGTLFTLATCEEKWGHLASAMTRYGDYLALYERLPEDRKSTPKEKERARVARGRLEKLAPQVSELALLLPPEAPAGTIIKRDGDVVAVAALGVGLPLDPGEHTITSQAPGGQEWEEKITLANGEKRKVTVAVKTLPKSAPPEPEPERTGPNSRRIATYVAGGVGVAGLAVGAVTGGLTLATRSTIAQHCGASVKSTDPTACDLTGLNAVSTGRTLGWVSTAALVVGVAGLGTAVALFATEPRAAKTGVRGRWLSGGILSLGPDGALAGVRGAW
jgi:hypothetical protein